VPELLLQNKDISRQGQEHGYQTLGPAIQEEDERERKSKTKHRLLELSHQMKLEDWRPQRHRTGQKP